MRYARTTKRVVSRVEEVTEITLPSQVYGAAGWPAITGLLSNGYKIVDFRPPRESELYIEALGGIDNAQPGQIARAPFDLAPISPRFIVVEGKIWE